MCVRVKASENYHCREKAVKKRKNSLGNNGATWALSYNHHDKANSSNAALYLTGQMNRPSGNRDCTGSARKGHTNVSAGNLNFLHVRTATHKIYICRQDISERVSREPCTVHHSTSLPVLYSLSQGLLDTEGRPPLFTSLKTGGGALLHKPD